MASIYGRYVLASDTHCSIHLLYINVCKILYMPVVFCNVMIMNSQTSGKLSFGSTQEKKNKLVLIEKTIKMGE